MNTKTKKLDDFINNLDPINEVKPDYDEYDLLEDFSNDMIKECGITDYKDKLLCKEMIMRGFHLGLDIGQDMDDDDICNDCKAGCCNDCKDGCCGNNSEDEE